MGGGQVQAAKVLRKLFFPAGPVAILPDNKERQTKDADYLHRRSPPSPDIQVGCPPFSLRQQQFLVL